MNAQDVSVNWPQVYVWLFLLQWLFNIGIAVWVYFRKADAENAKAIKGVAKDLSSFITESRAANESQNQRLSHVETTLEHMPTNEEVAQMRENVAKTAARVEGMSELLRRVDHQTNLIHEHLLRNH